MNDRQKPVAPQTTSSLPQQRSDRRKSDIDPLAAQKATALASQSAKTSSTTSSSQIKSKAAMAAAEQQKKDSKQKPQKEIGPDGKEKDCTIF